MPNDFRQNGPKIVAQNPLVFDLVWIKHGNVLSGLFVLVDTPNEVQKTSNLIYQKANLLNLKIGGIVVDHPSRILDQKAHKNRLVFG